MKTIFVTGPTGVGKTSLAYRLAQELQSSVVVCDSVQIFKRFNIGANKPTQDMRQKVDYKMLDRYDPMRFTIDNPMTARVFAVDALADMMELVNQGKIPVIEGSSTLYLNMLLYGNESELELTVELDKKEARDIIGPHDDWEKCLARVRKVLPNFELDMGRNDFYRLEKALALNLAGRSHNTPVIQPSSAFDVRGFLVDFNDEELFRILDFRCEKFIESGLIEEVIELIVDGVYDCKSASLKSPEKSIGYCEAFEFLKQLWRLPGVAFNPKEIHLNSFLSFLNRYQINTRQLVKTQRKTVRKFPAHPLSLQSSVDSLGRTPVDKHLEYILDWSFTLPEVFKSEVERQTSKRSPSEPSLELAYAPLNQIYYSRADGEQRCLEKVRKYLNLLSLHRNSLGNKLN